MAEERKQEEQLTEDGELLARERELDAARDEQLEESGALALEEEQEETGGGQSDEADDKAGDKGQEPGESAPFRFSDEGGRNDKDEDQVMEIVHNGQVHRLTMDRIKNLAQKGFDYDTKVGRHSKMVQFIESDPEAQKILNDYFQQRTSGVSPRQQQSKAFSREDYDTDEEWLQANMEERDRQWHQQLQQTQAQTQQQLGQNQQQQQVQQVQQTLMARDPEHYAEVVPRLDQMARQNLSLEQYQRVSSDPQALIEFYDWAKSRIVNEEQRLPDTNSGPQKRKAKPSFRAQSRGGEQTQKRQKDAWDMPKEEFDRAMAKLQGYD